MNKLLTCLFLLIFSGVTLAQTTVTVTVLDDLSEPLDGISVFAFDGAAYTGNSAITDTNGEASFDLANGGYRFRADVNGTQYFSDNQNHCVAPTCTATSMEIPRAVVVTVTSSAGGFEEGLSVYAFTGTTYANKTAVTGSDGVASLQLLQGDYRFRIDKSGTQYFTDITDHCSVPGCTSVSFEIPEPVTVSVTSGGAPAEGLNVYAFDGSTYVNLTGVADPNGEVKFSLLAGDYRFRIDKDGTQYFTSSVNHCAVPGCNTIAFDIPESVTVTVTEAGSPAEGLSVYAFDGTAYANKTGTTNVNGEVTFSLLEGDYRFRIDKSGTQFFTDTVNHCSVPGCTAVSFDIPANVFVSVTSSAGGPEAGLSVYAFDGSTYVNQTEVTNSSGVAEFTLPSGDYRFRVDKNGTQFFTDTANHCSVPGCMSIDYEIPEDIVVTVTNSGGSFETGLNVYAFDGSSYVNKTAVTDTNGRAVFTLPPGDYRFRIDKNGTQYFTNDVNHCSAPGCNAVSFEIAENVTVTVTSSAGGFEAGLNVYAFDGPTYVNQTAVTDVNGQAVFTLLDGDYRFRIDKNGTQFFTDAVNHCTLPGCTDVSFEVPEDITVTVNSSAGGPEVGLNVYAFDGSTYVNKTSITNADGEAVFTLLPGNYRFRIDKNGTQYFTNPGNHCAAPGCSAVSFEVPESVVVAVTSTSGVPQEGLNVYAFDGSVYANKSGVTNSDGEAAFTLLPGNYRFRVDKDGSQFFSSPTNHCAVPGCTFISAQVPSALSELVADPNLGLCIDTAATTNNWDDPGEVTALNCDNFGISNLSGIENFSNLNDLVLSNNAITLLGPLNNLSNLTNLDLSGNSLLECNQLGDLDSLYGAGIVTHPSTCLGEGELIFSVANPNQVDTNQFSFDVATTPAGDIVTSAITYNPGTDSFDGRVFLIDGTNGNQLLELENPAPSGSDYFGWSVATLPNGDIVVSAWQDDISGVDAGIVYVFSQIDGELLTTIENPAPDSGDRFGFSVTTTPSSSIVVGTPDESGGGAVYVFESNGALNQTITSPTGDNNAEFGRAVASLSNGDIVIGAPQQDVVVGTDTVANAGSVHLYTESGSSLLLIDNPDPSPNDDFGSEVAAATNDDIIVSARLSDNFATDDGSIAVFDSVTGSLLWSVANPVADDNGLFGKGLGATSQGDIVVGAANYDTDDDNVGRIYDFSGLVGDLIKIIENPNPSTNANFGEGLGATPADQIAIGAFGADSGFGELHLFTSIRAGESFTLLNEQEFGSDAERACVLEIAAENGWATLEEAGGFNFDCGSDTTPDQFNFIDLDDAIVNAPATSNVVTLTGFDGVLTAEVAIHTQAKNPEFSINGGPFTSEPQDVQAGDTIQLRFITPDITEFSSIATVSIGAAENGGFGVYDDWVVTTGEDVLGDLGFRGPYEVFGRSSTNDLFVRRDNSDGQVPGVSSFYLLQSSGGDRFYDLVPNITESQAIADGFDLNSPLPVDLFDSDLHGDGVNDLVIEGLNGLGGRNVLVYAGATLNSPPGAFVEIDAEFRNFYDDLANYLY